MIKIYYFYTVIPVLSSSISPAIILTNSLLFVTKYENRILLRVWKILIVRTLPKFNETIISTIAKLLNIKVDPNCRQFQQFTALNKLFIFGDLSVNWFNSLELVIPFFKIWNNLTVTNILKIKSTPMYPHLAILALSSNLQILPTLLRNNTICIIYFKIWTNHQLILFK